jgi:lipopolysaccharide/colanic/teichoic acid biosynthesis glycosyltransferase
MPAPKGRPPLDQYLTLLPFIALLVPLAFRLQGLYRLRRGRSRVDDFFAVLIGNIWAVLGGVAGTLYFRTYYLPDPDKVRGVYEVSQAVWVWFLTFNVALTYLSRAVVRELLRKRWRAGIGLKRVLIVGAGELGQMVADRILDHSDLGFQLTGFVDDRVATADIIGHRGLPVLGTVTDVVEFASRECIDVHVVPDLLQFIALKARLEDLDGLPLIAVNDVPLRGMNAVAKRMVDVALSSLVLLFGAIPAFIIAFVIKRSSPGPAFYRQERMGLDGKAFSVYKFRSMPVDAEDVTGPIWARDNDPRATAIGRWLRRHDVDELPQFWNVFRGDMSIVGPRPERPFFVEQFKHRIPSYMLRHKVKAGITGWAQVNGWRGNTSLEKRIEFDLYYIENWSLSLDLKIIGLTVLRTLNKFA